MVIEVSVIWAQKIIIWPTKRAVYILERHIDLCDDYVKPRIIDLM